MKKILCLLMAVFMISCASVHSGKYGTVVREDGSITKDRGRDLVVSGDTDKSLSNEYYKFMVFTFEDKSGRPAEISDIDISFGNDKYDSEIRAISGSELKHWNDAQMAEKERREKNRSTAFGATAIAGGLLSFIDGSIGNIGTGLLVGGAGALGADGLYKGNRDSERGKVYPETHLLSGEFQIPAGLYERRWIVLNIKNREDLPREVFLSYRDNGALGTVAVPIKW